MLSSPTIPSQAFTPSTDAMPPTVAMAGTMTPRKERTNKIRHASMTAKPMIMRMAHSREMTSFSSVREDDVAGERCDAVFAEIDAAFV